MRPMAYDNTTFEKRTSDTVEWLTKEFTSIRTGRATPTLLDSVQFDSYGARMPIVQAGSVGIENARTIRVVPWNQDQLQDIEKAINGANLGVSVVADDKGLRVMFPELTSERRGQLLRLAKTKLEDARVSLRKERDTVIRDLENDEKAGEISKDEKFRAKEEIQKKIDEINKVLEDMFTKKETEISE